MCTIWCSSSTPELVLCLLSAMYIGMCALSPINRLSCPVLPGAHKGPSGDQLRIFKDCVLVFRPLTKFPPQSLRLPGKSLPVTLRSSSSPERIGQDHHLDDRGTRHHTAANEGREGARAATQEERLRRNQRLPASHLPPSTWATRHSSTAFAKLATRALIPRCGIRGSSQVLHEAWRRVNLAIYFVFQTL